MLTVICPRILEFNPPDL